MLKEIRMNTVYNDLYKALKTNFKPCTIILTLPSSKATDCAYNGIDYTIRDIIKKLNEAYCDIKIEDFNVSPNYKNYQILRSNVAIHHNINLRVIIRFYLKYMYHQRFLYNLGITRL